MSKDINLVYHTKDKIQDGTLEPTSLHTVMLIIYMMSLKNYILAMK